VKNLSQTPSDSREMIEAVKKAGVKHRIDFNYRKVPAISYVKKMLEAGELWETVHSIGLHRAGLGFKAGQRIPGASNPPIGRGSLVTWDLTSSISEGISWGISGRSWRPPGPIPSGPKESSRR